MQKGGESLVAVQAHIAPGTWGTEIDRRILPCRRFFPDIQVCSRFRMELFVWTYLCLTVVYCTRSRTFFFSQCCFENSIYQVYIAGLIIRCLQVMALPYEIGIWSQLVAANKHRRYIGNGGDSIFIKMSKACLLLIAGSTLLIVYSIWGSQITFPLSAL